MPRRDPLWRPRISVITTEQNFNDLQRLIPWGMRDKLFNAFADELVRIGELLGPMAYGLLVSRGFKVILNGETYDTTDKSIPIEEKSV